MKRIGLFLFFCILSLHGIAQVENDKDTLIIRQDKINEFINEMNEADKSMDFINEPPTLTPPVLSDTLRMPKFDFTPREEMPKISPYTLYLAAYTPPVTVIKSLRRCVYITPALRASPIEGNP